MKKNVKQKLNHKERQQIQEQKNNAIITRLASIFFITIMAFYPMFIGLRKYTDLTGEKTRFFWIATACGVVAIVFIIVSVKRSGIDDYYVRDEPIRRITVAEWALIAFIGLAFISAFASAWFNPGWASANQMKYRVSVWFGMSDRFEGFISFLAYAANFAVIARFYKPKRLHLLLISGSAILVSLYGIMQMLGLDIFNLFPYDLVTDTFDGSLHGPVAAFFRTTLGNVNIVSAYCSFAILLFTGLYAGSRSKWQYLYLGAGIMSFSLSLTTGNSGDAHTVAILGAMILLIPYWISERERLGRVFIMISGWCIAYAGQSAYLSAMKRRYEAGGAFAPNDQHFLSEYSHTNIALFLVLAGVLLGAGVTLVYLLKNKINWNTRITKMAGIIFLPVLLVGGLLGIGAVGARYADNPNNVVWQAREMMHGRFEDHFGSGRVWIWKRAVAVIPDNPVLGTGPDTFYHAMGEEWQMESRERYHQYFDKAHNVFLQTAVTMGIPALLAYLVFLGGVFVPAVKRAFERPLLLAFGGAALSYVIQGFFCVEVPITTPLVWIALGVMAGEVWMDKVGYEKLEL